MVDIIQGTPTDDRFPALVDVSLLTERAHTGNLFSTTHEFNNIASGGVAEVLIQPPENGDEIHVVTYSFTPDTSGETIQLFEGADASDVGVAPDDDEPTQRNDGYTPSATVTVGPTLNSPGAEITREVVPTGKGALSGDAAVEIRGVDWGLDPGTDYLLRFTNDSSNQAATVFFVMLRYRFLSEELKQ